MKGHDPAGRNRYFLASLWIAPRALRFVAQLKIAETGQLDAIPVLQAVGDFLEERLDHFLGFTLIEAYFFRQSLGEVGFCESHNLTVAFDGKILLDQALSTVS